MQIRHETTNNRGLSFYLLSRHLYNNHLCDDTSRWWPLWYEYISGCNAFRCKYLKTE